MTNNVSTFDWAGSCVLVTGGTGSFGRRFVDILLRRHPPKRLIVFSRDEVKQHEMQQAHPETSDSCIRYFLGDIRDKDRLHRAFRGVNVVVHAAALKQVPACEYNPFEAVQTNIIGTKNIIDAAIDNDVQRVLALSTAAAVRPFNLYGGTKLVAEKLFVQGNAYAGGGVTRFSCVRWDNVVGSRGSVIPLFEKQRQTGTITMTDEGMTRFWITLDQSVRFVIACGEQMQGGEVFVPKMPSARITDLARTIAPDCKIEFTGMRPGDKLHEELISPDESRNTIELDDRYVVQPAFGWRNRDFWSQRGRSVSIGFRFGSDTNSWWLTDGELRKLVAGV